MKKIAGRYLLAISVSLMALLLFIYMQSTYSFVFYNMEMQRIFVWDAAWCGNILFTIGGFATLLNGFLVQFFILPFTGALITTLLLTAISLFVWTSCRTIFQARYIFPLCLMPVAYLMVGMFCFSYVFQDVTNFFLGTLFLWLYTLTGPNALRRAIAGALLAAVLFLLTGSVAVYFALCAALLDLLAQRPKPWIAALPFITVLILGGISIRAAWLADYKAAFLPLNYYMYQPESVLFAYMGWILAMAAMVCFFIARHVHAASGRPIVKYGIGIVLCAGIGIGYFHSTSKFAHERQLQFIRFSYYAECQQWDKILEEGSRMDMNNYMLLNFMNLALSHKGMLLQHLHDFNQQSPYALCIKSDMTQGCMTLLAMIYFQMGNIANAQDMAFEANQGSMNAFCMKMLVETNLIFGSYGVAERYITTLEKTLLYRKWAKEERRFLYNDKAVEADSWLGPRRKSLPRRDHFVERDGIFADLDVLLEANPNNKAASDYAAALILLARDKDALHHYVDKYYGTPALRTLTPEMQYGLIVATEDSAYCASHGVTKEIMEMYRNRHSMTQY